jgi:hypothetical protein
MPRYSKMKFPDYRDWLEFTYGLETRTVNVYLCWLRRILESIEAIDHDNLQAYFDQVYLTNKQKYYQHKAAWSRFAQWSLEIKSVAIPNPKGRDEEDRHPPLPEEVSSVLCFLMGKRLPDGRKGFGLSPEHIRQTKWKHVEVAFPSVRGRQVHDPFEKGRTRVFPKEWIEVLEKFADPQGDKEVPLIPLSPGSLTPYPSKGLKRAYKKQRQYLSQS